MTQILIIFYRFIFTVSLLLALLITILKRNMSRIFSRYLLVNTLGLVNFVCYIRSKITQISRLQISFHYRFQNSRIYIISTTILRRILQTGWRVNATNQWLIIRQSIKPIGMYTCWTVIPARSNTKVNTFFSLLHQKVFLTRSSL